MITCLLKSAQRYKKKSEIPNFSSINRQISC